MTFHALTGLPRSGSTLLRNTLTTCPTYYAGPTSPLSNAVASALASLNGQVEYRHLLNAPGAERIGPELVQAMIRGFYAPLVGDLTQHVFDKDRSGIWMLMHDVFLEATPGHMFVLVRDPRECAASIIKAQRLNPTRRFAQAPNARLLTNQLEILLGPEHALGNSLNAVTNLLSSPQRPRISFHRYEDWTRAPQKFLQFITETTDTEFEFDIENVPELDDEPDGQWLGLFPHKAGGAIEYREPTWPQVLPPWMAQQIVARNELFCRTFGYV